MSVPRGTPLPVKVVGSSKFGPFPKQNAETTYNMFMSDGYMLNFPGYKRVLELLSTATQGRGIFRSIRGNLIIAVIDSAVYELDNVLGITFVGTLNTTSGPVIMDENLNGQICIVDGLNAWIYNRITKSFTLQAMPADLIPNYVTFHDTYFLFGNADFTGNGAKWFAFSYATDTTITQTYELALQTKPDYARAVVRIPGRGNNVLVLGNTVGEIHTNVGGLQGYQRLSYLSLDYGLQSIESIAESEQFVAFVGVNQENASAILLFDGQNIKHVSTDGIDYRLELLSRPDKVVGFFFKRQGHLFYQLTWYDSEDNLTLAYDVYNDAFYNVTDQYLNYHPARQVIFANNQTYFISLNNGYLYRLANDLTSYDENLVPKTDPGWDPALEYQIPMVRVANTIRLKNSDRFITSELVITMQNGNDENWTQLGYAARCSDALETVSGDPYYTMTGDPYYTSTSLPCNGYTPHVGLSFSTDGGVTFSNEVRNELNYLGDRKNIMNWHRLGLSNEMTPKFKFWGTGRFTVTDGVAYVRQ